MTAQPTRIAQIVKLTLMGLALSQVTPMAHAAENLNLGTVNSDAQGNGSSGSATGQAHLKSSAKYQAPAKAPLKAKQPTSVISKHYIENNVPLTANYDSIVTISPSVSSVDPNGPGLMEDQGLTMRGFQNGEYNLTFDGIPWGDSNDFTHHSTSYFMANQIGQISVDRGPGTASTIGDATFGGTIAIHSKDPSPIAGITPYASFGSFGTKLQGIQFNTGTLKNYNDSRAIVDIENMTSNGYLTNAHLQRKSAYFKLLRPVGDSTVVSLTAMYNRLHQNFAVGATKAQIDKYGANYGMSNDPTKQNYYGYNFDDITTYFTALGIDTQLTNGLKMSNKLYTYGYFHTGKNGLDPNGETPNGTNLLPTPNNDVHGQEMRMNYQEFGDVLRFTQATSLGDLKYGLWYAHQWNDRYQAEIDLTQNSAFNPNAGLAGPYNAIDRDMHDTLDSAQPYIEFDWKLSPKLTLTPGVKYAWFRRSIDATVNQDTGLPLNYSKTYSAVLPSVALHYMIKPHWSAYAQVAKGFLAPNLNFFYNTNPAASSPKPQSTTNYQIGTAYQTDKLTLAGDIYYIDFANKVNHRKVGSNVIYYNEGGVIYKGIEGSATVAVGGGFNVYANGSLNSAKEKNNHQWIANAPKSTAAFGLIYNRGPVYASLLNKFVGSRYGDSGETQKLGSYNVTNLSLGYDIHTSMTRGPVKLKFKINNLFDNKKIYGLAGYTAAANTPLYWTIPGRSFEFSVSTKF